MEKFRVEMWRIVKYALITPGLTLLLTLLPLKLIVAVDPTTWSIQAQDAFILLWIISVFALPTAVSTLLNRFFTFRATEPWFIAAPLMIVLNFFCLAVGLAFTTEYSLWLLALVIIGYPLERYVIYRHTTDTNGWYRRFHPTNDEKGE